MLSDRDRLPSSPTGERQHPNLDLPYYLPPPEEIARQTARIRAGWSARRLAAAAAHAHSPPVAIRNYHHGDTTFTPREAL